MILALAYCHKDAIQARRLLSWIGYLSDRDGQSMLNARILLVASRTATRMQHHQHILNLAGMIFKEAYLRVPPGEEERGWPISCNHLFKEALFHVERHFGESMMWVEPDCVPLVPNWFDSIKVDYNAQNREFMGERVEAPMPHGSGVGVYSREWRRLAPSLATATHQAWDTHSAHEILPHFHSTPLIQHVFNNPPILDRTFRPGAALFHQCKTISGIAFRDRQLYGGACATHPLFGYDQIKDEPMPVKFYSCMNASRPYEARGITFTFTACYQHAGAWFGVLASENESEQVALADLVNNPRNGIEEINQAQYDANKKKASPTQALSSFRQSETGWNPRPNAQVLAALKGDGAAVADRNLSASPEQLERVQFAAKVSDANDPEELVRLGPVRVMDAPVQRKVK